GFVRFGPQNDHITLLSVFKVDPAQSVSGQTLSLTINGLNRTFTFDAHGNAVASGAHARLYINRHAAQGPLARFTLRSSGPLKAALVQGVSVDANGNPKKLAVTLSLGTKLYGDVKVLNFKRTIARFGFGR